MNTFQITSCHICPTRKRDKINTYSFCSKMPCYFYIKFRKWVSQETISRIGWKSTIDCHSWPVAYDSFFDVGPRMMSAGVSSCWVHQERNLLSKLRTKSTQGIWRWQSDLFPWLDRTSSERASSSNSSWTPSPWQQRMRDVCMAGSLRVLHPAAWPDGLPQAPPPSPHPGGQVGCCWAPPLPFLPHPAHPSG